MAHLIDTTEGRSAFVSARQDAWHRLGTTLESTFTAEQAMEHGLLGGWDVRKTPIYAHAEDGSQILVPNRAGVLRTNPVTKDLEVIGDVGASYTIIQNEEHAALLNALVDEGGAHFETAGALDGGRRVFITMKLPGHMKIGGVDRVDNYIAALNSHDGSLAFTFLVTPVRIVCQNTLNIALGRSNGSFRVRHTSGADKIMVQQARETLDMTFNYLDGFQEQAERLINTEMTQSRFEEIITREFSAPEDAATATVTRSENKIEEMFRLYADSYTHEGIRDTAWAALNTLTEWADHYSPTRGENQEQSRAVKSVLDPSFKNRATKLVLAEAGL